MREVKKKEAKKILSKLQEILPELQLSIKTLFEHEVSEELKFYTSEPDRNVVAIAYQNQAFPSLNVLWKQKIRPKDRYLLVDEGAIKPLLRGAKILRPGVLEAQGISKNSLCFVLEAVNRTPIAVGYCLLSPEELQNSSKGVVALNIHRIGDKIWKVDFP
jgi:predicted RNA-binding protein (TIGR00451 family)